MVFGVVDLGLTPADFWQFTPRQLHALSNRYQKKTLETWKPFALLAALYANAHRDTKTHSSPYTVDDFMPQVSQPEAPRPQTLEEQVYMLEMWARTQPPGYVKITKTPVTQSDDNVS